VVPAHSVPAPAAPVAVVPAHSVPTPAAPVAVVTAYSVPTPAAPEAILPPAGGGAEATAATASLFEGALAFAAKTAGAQANGFQVAVTPNNANQGAALAESELERWFDYKYGVFASGARFGIGSMGGMSMIPSAVDGDLLTLGRRFIVIDGQPVFHYPAVEDTYSFQEQAGTRKVFFMPVQYDGEGESAVAVLYGSDYANYIQVDAVAGGWEEDRITISVDEDPPPGKRSFSVAHTIWPMESFSGQDQGALAIRLYPAVAWNGSTKEFEVVPIRLSEAVAGLNSWFASNLPSCHAAIEGSDDDLIPDTYAFAGGSDPSYATNMRVTDFQSALVSAFSAVEIAAGAPDEAMAQPFVIAGTDSGMETYPTDTFQAIAEAITAGSSIVSAAPAPGRENDYPEGLSGATLDGGTDSA
jgi:hypothetical protein